MLWEAREAGPDVGLTGPDVYTMLESCTVSVV